MALTLAESGNIYVVGGFNSLTMTIGSDTLTDSLYGGLNPNYFIAKFDNNGNPKWAKAANQNLKLNDIKSGKPGNIFVTGYSNSGFTLGSTHLPFPGAIIIDYDSTGSINWANVVTGGITASANKLAPDSCGNVWISGFVRGLLTCDTTIVDTPAMCSDPIFIAAYDKCGRYIAGTGHVLGSGADDQSGLALDNRGNLFTGGDYEYATMIIGPDTLVNPGPIREYLMLAKYHTGTMPCGSYLCNPATLYTGTNFGNEPVISIYPNPASTEFIIQNDHSFAQEDKAELYDMAGRLIGRYALNGKEVAVSVISLKPGIYQCRIMTGENGMTVKKVVILR